jgi:hypothetical protein
MHAVRCIEGADWWLSQEPEAKRRTLAVVAEGE